MHVESVVKSLSVDGWSNDETNLFTPSPLVVGLPCSRFLHFQSL